MNLGYQVKSAEKITSITYIEGPGWSQKMHLLKTEPHQHGVHKNIVT